MWAIFDHTLGIIIAVSASYKLINIIYVQMRKDGKTNISIRKKDKE